MHPGGAGPCAAPGRSAVAAGTRAAGAGSRCGVVPRRQTSRRSPCPRRCRRAPSACLRRRRGPAGTGRCWARAACSATPTCGLGRIGRAGYALSWRAGCCRAGRRRCPGFASVRLSISPGNWSVNLCAAAAFHASSCMRLFETIWAARSHIASARRTSSPSASPLTFLSLSRTVCSKSSVVTAVAVGRARCRLSSVVSLTFAPPSLTGPLQPHSSGDAYRGSQPLLLVASHQKEWFCTLQATRCVRVAALCIDFRSSAHSRAVPPPVSIVSMSYAT